MGVRSFTGKTLSEKGDFFTFSTLWANSADDKLNIFIIIFPRKQDLTFHANCLQWRFSGENKKNVQYEIRIKVFVLLWLLCDI